MITAKTFRRLLLPALLLFLSSISFAQPAFKNKIPIPYRIDRSPGNDTLRLTAHNSFHKFNPADISDRKLNGTIKQPNGIKTSVYNLPDSIGKPNALTIFGPTLIWHSGERINLLVKNKLTESTTTHWHGAEIPAIMDGGPHQEIKKDSTWRPWFTDLNKASTLWYHPHFHDMTIQQVSHGLSGMIINQEASDAIVNTLPRTYGVDDVPLILADFGLTQKIDTIWSPGPPPFYRVDTTYEITDEKGLRPYNMVNGVTNPFVEVPAAWIRLRILNGSTRKGIQFGVSNAYDSLGKIPFILIATDGGYMLKPDTLLTLLTGPGAREEILLNLTGKAGDSIYLSNMKHLMPASIVGSPLPAPNGGPGNKPDSTGGKSFLKLLIKPVSNFPNYTPVTNFTSFTTNWGSALSDTLGVNRRREKQLIANASGGFSIDNTTFVMDRINDTICVGDKEIWTIKNISKIAHPFHIHKVFFRVLDIVDSLGNNVDPALYGYNGRKDDVMVLAGWTLRFLTKFDLYPTHIEPHDCYMYHCHILTHEDAVGGGMMHQFVVTDDAGCSPQKLTLVNELVLFPNPTSGELFLRGPSSLPSTIEIFDLMGRLISKQNLLSFINNATINIEGIPPGMYIVRWKNSKETLSGKVIISR